ncbi:hypothetical protein QQS21_010763 [Conoideocrella luteorostrata]|uniref:Glycosyl transferase CAP10 domain-containing protein n=1 Tax=Conoideocrella luteorostrata TaxID=1105319 RepID=A0AAJ0CGP6_9HYPO|nr:hypothetical protein QQS21_010763 [Conoideocrella luteorostrata]
MRREASQFDMTINVRDGAAKAGSDWFWTKVWLNLIKAVEHLLADMDIALNTMDGPRLVVPWEEIDAHMKSASKTVKLARAKTMNNEFRRWPAPRTGFLAGNVTSKAWEDNVCHRPDLQGLEGILVHPLSASSTKTCFPMFGGPKLALNNEILLPAPMYWNKEERFGGGNDHGIQRHEKANKVIWHGVATGGKNFPDNWRGSHRHRFVSMNDGTKIGRTVLGRQGRELSEYGVQAEKDARLGPMVDEFADQYHNKFVPDIDGNSLSGRYLGFLRSASLPIKTTIFRKWRDSRLLHWKHFVPTDSRFLDYYGIMEYFLGYEGCHAHDKAAERIAMEGKEWAEKVLRKEDMSIYVLRLLLEYARVVDDDRESMGWVQDVIRNPSLEKSWKRWW